MASAGKHVTNDKRGTICDQWQGRENMSPTASTRKHVTNSKSGKTCNQWQAREDMEPMASAVRYPRASGRHSRLIKHVTSDKH